MANRNINIYALLGLNTDSFTRGLNRARTDYIGFRDTVRGGTSGISEAFKSLGGVGGILKFAGIAGGIAIIGNEFKKAIQYSIQFEKSLSNLQALTGASSADMRYYRQAATELGGVFGKTGSEMAETFKIVGSGKSELLKNKEGLVEVSAAAITLSKAAGMDVPSAADALVVAMNQFNAPASQANRYINAMAAGAKEGAAEIPNLANSLTKFGSVANALKIPIEQSIAMIEALSEKGLKDEVAGTGIKTFLLRLEQGARDTRPSVVGLDQALTNLKKKNLSVNEAQQMFGMEAANVAIALISQTDRVKQLTKEVSNTNEAFKQSSINGDNVAGALQRLSSGWTNFKESLLNSKGGLSSFLKGVLDDFNQVLYGANLMLKSKTERKEDTYKRSNSLEVENYKRSWAADSNEANLKRDMADFYSNKTEWVKRYEEARKRNDEDEIYKAGYKIKLYNQLLSLAKEELKSRNAPKLEVAKADVDQAKLTKLANIYQEYKYEADKLKELHKLRVIDEEEYSNKRIANLQRYIEAASKLGKNVGSQKEELSKMFTDKLIREDAAVKVEFPKLKMEDTETFFYNLEKDPIPIPIDINFRGNKTEKVLKDKFNEYYQQAQEQLHPLELDVTLNGFDSVTGALTSFKGLGDVMSSFEEKAKAGKLSFWDYITTIQESVNAIRSTYDGISSVISIIQALDAAKKVSAVVSSTTATTEIAANAAKSGSNIAAATTSVGASAAEGTASAIASVFKSIPYPWNLILAASAGAAAYALFSGLLRFEDGGVVGGSSFSGDKILARVNSGEMVLNKAQQSNLFNMINGGVVASGKQSESMIVGEVKLSANDIAIVLKRLNKKTDSYR